MELYYSSKVVQQYVRKETLILGLLIMRGGGIDLHGRGRSGRNWGQENHKQNMLCENVNEISQKRIK